LDEILDRGGVMKGEEKGEEQGPVVVVVGVLGEARPNPLSLSTWRAGRDTCRRLSSFEK